MPRPLTSWLEARLLVLGYLVALEASEPEDILQLKLINFNFDTVRVTWNSSVYPGTNLTLFYTFGSVPSRQCPTYLLDQGYVTGCLLDVEPGEEGDRDVVLDYSISNQTWTLLKHSVWISAYLKPSSPNGFNFLWSREAVTVTCLDLPYGGLIYEVQYKSSFDSDWESVKEETCRLTIENLDGDKCYGLRGRIRTKESSYGSDTYPSDWTEVTYWQGGQRTDECPVDEAHFPKVMLISALVVVLTVILLLLSLCKIHRVKKFLMPSVPDPKFTFSGLFEDHRGNFQEWIKDTQNVAEVCKLDNGEEECALEDTLVAQLVKMESQAAPEGKPCPETQLEGDEGTHKSPHQTPQHGDVVALGGFTFVVNENAYVML